MVEDGRGDERFYTTHNTLPKRQVQFLFITNGQVWSPAIASRHIKELVTLAQVSRAAKEATTSDKNSWEGRK